MQRSCIGTRQAAADVLQHPANYVCTHCIHGLSEARDVVSLSLPLTALPQHLDTTFSSTMHKEQLKPWERSSHASDLQLSLIRTRCEPKGSKAHQAQQAEAALQQLTSSTAAATDQEQNACTRATQPQQAQ